jgi:ubiquinone/menaquinone biosynthesis C-methylase UbiE
LRKNTNKMADPNNEKNSRRGLRLRVDEASETTKSKALTDGVIYMEINDRTIHNEREFTPAFPLLWAYDLIVAAVGRERTWRGAFLRQLDPRPSDIIADIGCGTGTFLALLGRTAKWAKLIGVDPDDRILWRARRKLEEAGIVVTLKQGYLRDASSLLSGAGVDKITSSLVFHQVPLAEKRAGFSAIYSALPPGGELHLADFGLQRTRLMRTLFRIVQYVDGYENTQPNADGILPSLMKEAGFAQVQETAVIPTLTGSISLYKAIRPPTR